MLQEVALLTDGRFSGGSHGFVVGHICPEAQVPLLFINVVAMFSTLIDTNLFLFFFPTMLFP